MNLTYFPNFVRANIKGVDWTNSELTDVGIEFKEYLQLKFKDNPERLIDICKIEPRDVIQNISKPFSVNGYDAVLVLHFTNFCKEGYEKSLIELNKNK